MKKWTFLVLLIPWLGLMGQNVGINTKVPQATLHLNGNLKFQPNVAVEPTRLVGVTLNGDAREFAMGDTFAITNGTLEVTETIDPNVFLISDIDQSGTAGAIDQYDNYDIGLAGVNATSAIFRISGETNGYSVTGFKDGYDGRIIYFLNSQNHNATFFNLHNGSDSENQIITGSGANEGISNKGVAEFIYDGTLEKWILINIRS